MKNLLILQLFTAVLTSVILFALFFNKNEVDNQNDRVCMPLSELYNLLESEFNEEIKFISQSVDKPTWSFLTFNSQTGSWTWIAVDSDGQACVEWAGIDGYLFDKPNKAPLDL